jgi:hypothetical protein
MIDTSDGEGHHVAVVGSAVTAETRLKVLLQQTLLLLSL